MAVAFDAVGPSAAGANAGNNQTATTLTWSHTCTGTNLYLVVGASAGSAAAATGTMTATYNGVAMTVINAARSNNAGAGIGKVFLFGLANPATGANNVVLTSSAAATLSGGSSSYTGVGGLGGNAIASGQSTAPTVSVGATAATSMVVQHCGDGSGFTATSQTLLYRANVNIATSAGNSQGSSAVGGGTITFTDTAPNDDWGVVAVELVQVPPIGAEFPIRVARQAVTRSYSF